MHADPSFEESFSWTVYWDTANVDSVEQVAGAKQPDGWVPSSVQGRRAIERTGPDPAPGHPRPATGHVRPRRLDPQGADATGTVTLRLAQRPWTAFTGSPETCSIAPSSDWLSTISASITGAVAIQAREVLWRAPGTSPVPLREELWAAAPDALLSASGDEIFVGLGERREDGMWSTRFAVVLSGAGATVLGVPPFAERQTAILEMFRTWGGNPRSEASARDLIVSWNEEAARGGGPIQEAWERFVDQVVLEREAYPRPGTPEWWAAPPPICRSILDAPEDVRRELTPGTVWVRVPAAWGEVRDTVLCLQTTVGSGGCYTFRSAGPRRTCGSRRPPLCRVSPWTCGSRTWSRRGR